MMTEKKEGMRQTIVRIDEDREERMLDRLDCYSRILGWATIGAAIVYILVPAVARLWLG